MYANDTDISRPFSASMALILYLNSKFYRNLDAVYAV